MLAVIVRALFPTVKRPVLDTVQVTVNEALVTACVVAAVVLRVSVVVLLALLPLPKFTGVGEKPPEVTPAGRPDTLGVQDTVPLPLDVSDTRKVTDPPVPYVTEAL